jgi:hypothetical protein
MNKANGNLSISVPLSSGPPEEIQLLSINEAVKTLGSMTCPSGNNSASLEKMRIQGQEWADRVNNGKINLHNMWTMMERQLWPRIGYGICNNTAKWDDLEKCLRKVYYQIIPRGGIRRSAPATIWQMDRGFYGAGCPHPGVECLIEQVTKLLIHYGSKSGLSLEIQASMELMIIDLRVSEQPLGESYLRYGKLITHCWLKSLWKKVDKFQIDVLIGPLNIDPPRVGDKWLMRAFIEAGYTRDDELLILNWVRCHQQTLFLSDVLDTGGKNIDSKYLNRQPNNKAWSSLVFPIEKPPNRHISLWREALQTIAPRGRVDNPLG